MSTLCKKKISNVICIMRLVSLCGMYISVSMDTECWLGTLDLPSPSKFRTGWGNGWVVLILGDGAHGRRESQKGE